MHFLKIQRKWFAYYKQNYPLFDNHLKNFYRLIISYTLSRILSFHSLLFLPYWSIF